MTQTGDSVVTRHRIGVVALAGYIATVVLANYFIQHVGHVSFPHGPHTISVGFGNGHGCGRDAVRFLRVVPGEPRWYVCGIHAAVALREMGRG